MDKSIRIIIGLAAVVLVASAIFISVSSQTAGTEGPESAIYFFYGEECPHCHDVMPFMINISEKYPEANIRMLEIWHNQSNQAIYASVHEKLNKPASGVPEVVVGSVVLVGARDIPAQLERLIQERLKR